MHTPVKRQCTTNLPSQMLALEPRYLFDAAVVTTVVDTTSAPTADTSAESTNTNDSNQDNSAPFPALAEVSAVDEIGDQGFFIDENSAVNSFAGQILPAPEGVTFTLIDGMDSDSFAVSETGEITVKDSSKLNYEDSSLPTFPIESTGDGIETVTSVPGPIQIGGSIGENITVTGDPNTGLYTNYDGWGLTGNGTWGGDMTYISANDARPGSLLFSFNDSPVSAVGGFMNQATGGSDLSITAYDSEMNVLETYNITELADIVTPGGFNDGAFRGIDRGVNDISFFEVRGYVPVLDDLTFSRTADAAPVENGLITTDDDISNPTVIDFSSSQTFNVPYLQFQVEARADNGDADPATTTINIFMLLNDVNDAPEADTPEDTTVDPGDTATVQIIARDMDIFGDSQNDQQAWSDITYQLDPQPDDGPDDPKIDENGLFTWEPTEPGTTTFTVNVSNNGELAQTVQFDVTVAPPPSGINDSTDTGNKSESESSEESGEENGEEEGEENGEEGGEEGGPDAQAEGPADPAEEDTQKEAEKIEAEVEALVEDFSKTKEAPGAGKPEAQQPQTRAEEVAEIISIMDKAAALVTQCNVSQSPFL